MYLVVYDLNKLHILQTKAFQFIQFQIDEPSRNRKCLHCKYLFIRWWFFGIFFQFTFEFLHVLNFRRNNLYFMWKINEKKFYSNFDVHAFQSTGISDPQSTSCVSLRWMYRNLSQCSSIKFCNQYFFWINSNQRIISVHIFDVINFFNITKGRTIQMKTSVNCFFFNKWTHR